jgi:hypothetical protein
MSSWMQQARDIYQVYNLTSYVARSLHGHLVSLVLCLLGGILKAIA